MDILPPGPLSVPGISVNHTAPGMQAHNLQAARRNSNPLQLWMQLLYHFPKLHPESIHSILQNVDTATAIA